MKSDQAKSVSETLLKGIRKQLEAAEQQLQRFRAAINRTNEAIRNSREAIARTNTLVQPGERSSTVASKGGEVPALSED